MQRLADIVVNAVALLDGRDNAREIIIRDDHVGRLLRYFGALDAHGGFAHVIYAPAPKKVTPPPLTRVARERPSGLPSGAIFAKPDQATR